MLAHLWFADLFICGRFIFTFMGVFTFVGLSPPPPPPLYGYAMMGIIQGISTHECEISSVQTDVDILRARSLYFVNKTGKH